MSPTLPDALLSSLPDDGTPGSGAEAAPAWSLQLHGPPHLAAGARRVALERKTAGALAWLALRGPVLRGRLAEMLWPAASPDGARNNLRQLLFKLRRACGASLVEGQETLQLAAWLPVLPGDGELLEGCVFDDCPQLATWLATVRVAHRRQRQDRQIRSIDAALAANDALQAEARARELLAEDELAEPAHLRLVQALYLAGDRRGALAAAQRCEALLREQLDAEPSAELSALVRVVRQALEEADAAAARGAGKPSGAAGAVPMALLRPPRLVGRSRELSQMVEALRTGQVVVLSGEAGLGKTRLLAEVAEALGAGMLVLATRPGDRGVPYAALARWLRVLHQRVPAVPARWPAALERLVPDLFVAPAGSGPSAAAGQATVSSPAPAQADRGDMPTRLRPMDLAAAVLEVWRRAVSTGLAGAAFDDLHFADAASLDVLQTLLDDDGLRRWAWLLARRPAEGEAALQRIADALLDEDRLLPLALAPLDAAGVAALLASLGLPELDTEAQALELWRRTGGNPMFVLETLKALVLDPRSKRGIPAAAAAGTEGVDHAVPWPRPRTVTALIERRLRQLSPPALELARVAALAGPDFDTALAVHVLQRPLMALADAWAELEAAQVLRDQAFAHDLIFEATLATVPAPVARHARRSMAEFLAPRGGEPARIGQHWLAAGEPGLAAPHFVEAGRRAEAAARYAEAAELFERGARCHDDAGHAAQGFETRLALADLLMEAARLDDAQRVLDGAVSGAATADLRMRACMQQMHLHTRSGRTAEAVALGQRLLADDGVLDEVTPRRLAEVRWTLAASLLSSHQPEEALVQLELAEPSLAQAEEATWRCWYHSQLAVALNQLGELRRAQEAQGRSVDAARSVGRRRMLAGCLQNGATFATSAGQLVEALDLVDESCRLMAETGGDDIFSLFLRGQRGRLLLWLGRYGAALEQLEPLADDDTLSAQDDVKLRCTIALAELWARLGQPARARQRLAALGERGDLFASYRNTLAITACECAWMEGPEEHARASALSLSGLAWSGAVADHGALLAWRAQPGLLSLADAAARRASWHARGLQGHAMVALVLSARDAALVGHPHEAAAWAAEALAEQRKALLSSVYRPWLLLEIALAARAADPGLSDRALREGADWVLNVARYQLPEALRDGFLQRNRINRQLLSLVSDRP